MFTHVNTICMTMNLCDYKYVSVSLSLLKVTKIYNIAIITL